MPNHIRLIHRPTKPPLREGVGGRPLLQHVRRDALQREVVCHGLLECGLGAEHDAVTLDVFRGTELLVLHRLTGVALAFERYLESTDVFEHHHLTLVESLDDVVLHALEHCVAIRLCHSGRVVDTLGKNSGGSNWPSGRGVVKTYSFFSLLRTFLRFRSQSE